MSEWNLLIRSWILGLALACLGTIGLHTARGGIQESGGLNYAESQTAAVESGPRSSGCTIFVDDDNTEGPWDGTPEYPYQHIWQGVAAASPRDTVYVRIGTYYEIVTLDKTIHLVGENQDSTIIDGNGYGAVVFIPADSVTVTGFTVCGSRIFDSGIHLDDSDYSHISRNRVIGNQGSGIVLFSSCRNTISQNRVDGNNDYGIFLWCHSDRNFIDRNVISGSGWHGAYVKHLCNNNVISFNSLTGNLKEGIEIEYSRGNIFFADTIADNGWQGIRFSSARYNAFYGNVIVNNSSGIFMQESSSHNVFCCNQLRENRKYGAWLQRYWAYSNVFYHNSFVDNTDNVYDECHNYWDNGYFSGGN